MDCAFLLSFQEKKVLGRQVRRGIRSSPQTSEILARTVVRPLEKLTYRLALLLFHVRTSFSGSSSALWVNTTSTSGHYSSSRSCYNFVRAGRDQRELNAEALRFCIINNHQPDISSKCYVLNLSLQLGYSFYLPMT